MRLFGSFFYALALWVSPFVYGNSIDPSSQALPQSPTISPDDPAIPTLLPEPVDPISDASADEILVAEMQGLILVGHPDYVVDCPGPCEGVRFIALEPPGPYHRLMERLAPLFFHRPLTYSSIDALKKEIINFYQEHSHPVVMVFIPEQTVDKGVLQLVVIEATLGNIVVVGNNCFTPEDCFPYWMRIETGDWIDERILLEDVSWMNTNPFRRVNALFTPGEENGTTDIELHVTERRPWRIYVGGDNTGTSVIGPQRWFIGCNLANVFFPNNIFSYQYTTSANFRKFQSHTFQYVASLPWRDTLSFFGGYATAHPEFGPFITHAKTSQLSGRYTIPQLWARRSKIGLLNLDFGFDYKTTNNNLIFGEDNIPISQKVVWISQFVFSIQEAYNGNFHRIASGLEIFWSPGKLFSEHQTNADFDGLRPGARAHYVYGRLNYSHEIVLPYTWAFWAQGRLQLADGNLLASEQFSLGGYNTVRGYDERVVNGDNAVCCNFELRSLPFNIAPAACPRDSLVFLGFLDVGHAWDNEQIPGFARSQTLIGLGGGLRYNIGPFGAARFDLGYPMTKIETDSQHLRCHFSFVLNY